MTDIDALIESWEAAGVMFAIEGDTVTISLPADGLAADVVALLRDHKETIRALLRRRDALVRLVSPGCLVDGCGEVAIGFVPAAGDAGVCRRHGLQGHLLAAAAMAGRAEAAWPVAQSGDAAAARALLAALCHERANREVMA